MVNLKDAQAEIEKQNPWEVTEELLEKVAEYKQQRRARKEEWLTHHQERRPVYAPTDEEGTFVGLFGYATTVGARIFPYYRTESGIHFYVWENLDRDRKKTVLLDLDHIKREKSAIFYTPGSFLGDEPVAEPGVIPHQGDTPRTTK